MDKAYTKQKKHAAGLLVGDRVAYSAMFIKSLQLGHDVAKMRGTIIQLGGVYPDGMTNSDGDSLAGERMSEHFAIVQWDNKSPLKLVARLNLAKLKSAAFADAPHMGKTVV